MDTYGIECGTLIDGSGRPAQNNVFILIKNGRIARIEKNIKSLPKGISIIDAKKNTVIPGLIDAHKHVMNCGGSGIGVGLNYRQIKTNIEEISRGGVTSVLDLGSAAFFPHLEPLLGSKT